MEEYLKLMNLITDIKLTIKVLVKFIMISSTYILHAQDSHFSQFDKSPLMINPALAGALYKTQVNLNYRSQWSSVNSPFKTFPNPFGSFAK